MANPAAARAFHEATRNLSSPSRVRPPAVLVGKPKSRHGSATAEDFGALSHSFASLSSVAMAQPGEGLSRFVQGLVHSLPKASHAQDDAKMSRQMLQDAQSLLSQGRVQEAEAKARRAADISRLPAFSITDCEPGHQPHVLVRKDLPTDSRMRRRALDLRPGALPVLDLGSPMDTETETDSDSDDGVYAPATTGWLEI